MQTNSKHDLGTDLWLDVRDARRFDIGLKLGAQVKAGPFWFTSPERDAGDRVVGWWYYESDDDHFEHWCRHVVPHIIVLYNPKEQRSYWTAVVSEALVSTGKGTKILVPAASTVDEEHLEELTEFAARPRPMPPWEGSAWGETGDRISRSARLRTALITPRLIAPHPNRGYESLDPHQAIALLMMARIDELGRTRDGRSVLDRDDAAATPSWAWSLFDALHAWLVEERIDALRRCVESAVEIPERVAAIACLVWAHLERGEVIEAERLILPELARDNASPVDHAWLLAHAARVHLDLGRVDEAQEATGVIAALRHDDRSDPTAAAIVAAASHTRLVTDEPFSADIEAFVTRTDTVASWWRSQTLAVGLDRQFEVGFEQWSANTGRTVFTVDEMWRRCRSAMATAGVGGDGAGWGYAASLLARHELMQENDPGKIVGALNLLRLAGREPLVRRSVSQLLLDGPCAPLRELGRALDLGSATRTTLRADLAFVESAADVLGQADCDRHARWILDTLCDPEAHERALGLEFRFEDALLDTLHELLHAVDPTIRDAVRDYLVQRPSVPDGSTGSALGRLLRRVPHDEWDAAALEALARRPAGDGGEFRDAIEALRATRDPSTRQALLARIRDGDSNALASYGDVTDLPDDIARAAIERFAESVRIQLEEAQRGTYRLGGNDPLGTLVLLNIWHPDAACWSPVVDTLAFPRSRPSHLARGLRLLGQLADRTPVAIRDRIRPDLEAIAQRVDLQGAAERRFDSVDVRGDAFVTLAAFMPDELTAAEARRHLLSDEGVRRAAGARVLVAQGDPVDLTLLALLARDRDASVRHAAVAGLARWMVQGLATPAVKSVLHELVNDGGTRMGVWASTVLMDSTADISRRTELAALLATHPSAHVRVMVGNLGRGRDAEY